METPAVDGEFDVLNLCGVTPAELDALPDNALAESLRRVVRDTIERTHTQVASFDSAM
ncbi:FxSxx-COOH cyclophane-containing RiPP peptide [Streptomyces sp. GC420]|uniref:FxSxx-COOH cyclophane-containing RiPP peptide n=1 Tax=Streptomyces sp. GC420 TaxID=2697568 RepID=UPI001414E3DD|nr:FxSxx-COOH cyclophane-containing RiPP peptide [Streptomyces sp. GC420]NBM18610.1 FXSXX-COOH protein [Streptomyces sp. GC420]